MSKFTIHIGKRKFSSKSEALKHYKKILNLYEPKQILNQEDFLSIRQLVYKDFDDDLIDEYEKETGDYLKHVKVNFHPEFKRTKCFFLINGKNEEELFSYIYAINGVPNDHVRFTRACRFLVEPRLRKFKESIFEDRPVKCVITNKIVEWEECQIDHKSPLTFSVIVKSFIIGNNIDVSKVTYEYEITKEQFKDKNLAEKFDLYHKQMAVLRVISTKENNKLAAKSRIKPTKKDGILT